LEQNCVEVIIDGEVYKLVSVDPEEHIQKVASHINRKISEIYKTTSSSAINTQIKFLVLTINIADDYIKLQGKYNSLLKDREAQFSEKNMAESENHILKQKVKIIQGELDAARLELEKAERELEEYIETFGNEKNN
jgi:cell division protein ZapA (FtsZ GTPase activity inhibitor)